MNLTAQRTDSITAVEIADGDHTVNLLGSSSTESQEGDMSSIKRRFEEERSVSSFMNRVSLEQTNEHLWQEMMSFCLSNF
jgi:hypothetical protein